MIKSVTVFGRIGLELLPLEWTKYLRPYAVTLKNGKTKKSLSSLEFKLKAVELSNERGSLVSVANELNVSTDNIVTMEKRV
ncbi:MAG: hypothetical protein R2790_00865 [Flavobacterium haoranii]